MLVSYKHLYIHSIYPIIFHNIVYKYQVVFLLVFGFVFFFRLLLGFFLHFVLFCFCIYGSEVQGLQREFRLVDMRYVRDQSFFFLFFIILHCPSTVLAVMCVCARRGI